jgi:signal peptidase I
MTLTVLDAPDTGVPTVRVVGVPGISLPAPRRALDDQLRARSVPTRSGPTRSGARHAKPSDKGSRSMDHLLTLLAVIGIAMTAVTVFAAHSGLRPLVVKSGSMEPTIHTGAMVLVREIPASEIRVGDVVAVERADHTRVTHRVVSVEHQGFTASLVLKGDANEDPDTDPVVVARAGRMVGTLPVLGRVGGFLSSARGGFVLGCLFAGVALGVLRRKPSS